MHASLAALICALLPFVGGWLAAVIVGFVTLRKHFFEGLLIVLWASLPAIAWAIDGNWLLLMTNGVFGFLSVWLLAGLIKKTGSWSLTIGVSALMGLLAVLVVHLIFGEPHLWWIKQLSTAVSQGSQMLSGSVNADEIQTVIQHIAPFLTGLQTVSVLLFAIIALMGSRAIEGALLAQPYLNKELYFIRIHRVGIILLVVFGVLAIWGPLVFKDFLPVILLPFVLAGFSLVHGMVALKKLPSIWFFAFYGFVFVSIIFYPPLVLAVVVMSVMDSIVNFRAMNVAKK
ncbi:MAG: hypothetical protein CMF39_02435 [Legionellaceae bacterium]|nr:hypothetical protein [Legionellaceae bacterium]